VSVLAQRLGYDDDARLVIVSCDDLGSCHAINEGTFDALHHGAATCASIMVPAPWARDAALRVTSEDIGVHLTLNAEHERYRWGPITMSPSLLDGDGGFPRTPADLWEHADTDEVRRELRAQIERAVAWGIDVTHLAAHLSALTLRPELFDVQLDLAVEFALPLRLPDAATEHAAGFPFRALAADEGVVFPDHFVPARSFGSRARLDKLVAELQPGVTELHVQPAIDTPEVRALAPDHWSAWVDDHALVTDPAELTAHLAEVGAISIGFRDLREVQRA
jgi:chitin disaccharide deacetylase